MSAQEPAGPEFRLCAIAAVADDGSIGDGKRMPWHLPDDFKWFKARTLGHAVISGRKNFEAMGRPLPGRLNIVLTRDPAWSAEGATVARSLDEAVGIARASGDLSPFVIGGGEIYRQALPLVSVLFLTEVHKNFGSPVRFPDFDRSRWRETRREEHPADERHEAAMSFVVLERISR